MQNFPDEFPLSTHSEANVREVLKPSVLVTDETGAKFAENSIDLGDGKPVTVRFRAGNRNPPVVIGSLAKEYNGLVSRAQNGDAEAALALAQALVDCEIYGYRTEGEYRAALVSFESRYRIPKASGDGAIEVSTNNGRKPVDVDYWRGVLTSAYENCKELPADAVSSRAELIELAAKNGSLSALRQLAENSQNNLEKLRLFEQAWAEGDYHSALWVGHGYEQGWNGTPDLITGFAYMKLGLELTKLTMTDEEGAVTSFYDRIARGYKMEQRALTLGQEEHAQAIKLAKDILERNPNCCLGLLRINHLVRQQND